MNALLKFAMCCGVILAMMGIFAPVAIAANYDLSSAEAGQLVRLASGCQYYQYGDVLVPAEIGVRPYSAFGGNSWPGGLVYVEFDTSVSAAHKQLFLQTVAQWEAVAGVRFVEDSTQPNQLLVQEANGVGCGYSSIGIMGGVQDLAIAPDPPPRCYQLVGSRQISYMKSDTRLV